MYNIQIRVSKFRCPTELWSVPKVNLSEAWTRSVEDWRMSLIKREKAQARETGYGHEYG